MNIQDIDSVLEVCKLSGISLLEDIFADCTCKKVIKIKSTKISHAINTCILSMDCTKQSMYKISPEDHSKKFKPRLNQSNSAKNEHYLQLASLFMKQSLLTNVLCVYDWIFRNINIDWSTPENKELILSTLHSCCLSENTNMGSRWILANFTIQPCDFADSFYAIAHGRNYEILSLLIAYKLYKYVPEQDMRHLLEYACAKQNSKLFEMISSLMKSESVSSVMNSDFCNSVQLSESSLRAISLKTGPGSTSRRTDPGTMISQNENSN